MRSVHDALAVVERRAAHVFSLKVPKSGGITRTRKTAAVAGAAGIRCFGGTSLATFIGTAASLHLFCVVPNPTEGSGLFGPLLLADDVAQEPPEYRDFRVWRPRSRGLGVALDEEKVDNHRRR